MALLKNTSSINHLHWDNRHFFQSEVQDRSVDY
ncbi:rCG63219 [Rattus norvegicus]|uniref:RCG63219 n=1 Tax=Rattus norvegicus TaxID=10116 RepID=A6JRE4_RAT|nr:rCG63219 [Rattus norvegicus]